MSDAEIIDQRLRKGPERGTCSVCGDPCSVSSVTGDWVHVRYGTVEYDHNAQPAPAGQ